MADNIIKVGIDVSDNGTSAKSTKNVEKLKDIIDQTKVSATKAGAAIGSMSSGRVSAAQTRATQAQASQSYGVARGTVGTGAEGRDFAKQSQGLGGLVRLYATFAANIFAAEAAFRALSNAANTANLVKGLDQLGASAGKNLGFTAKQLVAATDGAVSLREALQATAKASAAGLSSENILKLGKVAKQASQALGVDMADALSRLSRGVTKLEPELLDELGLFTKIDKASQDYARSVGKSALSLSDFEKRQAFANAVLAEGAEKFNAISLAPNPYAKITANLQNLSAAGLGVINTVLSPLLNLLAESPTALALGIAYIAKTLLVQALPALTQWRVGLADSAKRARQAATDITESFGAAYVEKLQNSLKIPDLKNQIAQYESDLLKLQKIPEGLSKAKSINTILSMGGDATEAQLKSLDSLMSARKRKIAEIGDATDAASKTAKAGYEAEILYLQKVKTSTESLILAKKALNTANDKAVDIATTEKATTGELIRTEIARKAIAKSARLDVLLPVAERTKELGFLEARKQLIADTAERGITGFNKFRTVATGTFSAAATSIGMFAQAFGAKILGGIGTALIAYELLGVLFSKNSKEVEKFNASIEESRSYAETLNNTLDVIYKKNIGDIFSIKSIVALAEALKGLTGSLGNLVQSLDKADIKASTFDRFIDGILGVIGKDLQTKFAEEFAFSINEGFKALPEGPAKETAKQKLTSLIGGTEVSFIKVKAAIEKLPSNKVVEFGNTLAKAMQTATNATTEAANKLQQVSNSIDLASKSYDEFVQSQASTDPITKLGSTMVTAAIDIAEAFKDPINSLAILKKLVGETGNLKLFPESMQKNLLNAAEKIEQLSNTVAQAQKQIVTLNQEIETKGPADQVSAKGRLMPWQRKDAQTGLTETQSKKQQVEEAKDIQKAAQAEIVKLQEQFGSTLANSLISRGLDLIFRQVTEATKQASLTVSRAIAAGMSGVGTADITARLKQQELNIQQEQINTTQSLNYTLVQSNILAEEANALKQVELNQAQRNLPGPLPADFFEKANKDLARLQEVQRARVEVKESGITREQFEKLTPELQKILQPFLQASLNTLVKSAQIRGQREAATIEQKVGNVAEQEAVKKRELQYALESKNIELQRVSALSAGSTIINQQLLTKKQQLELETESRNNAIKVNDIDVEINKAQVRYLSFLSRGEKDNAASALANKQDLETQKLRTIELNNQNSELFSIRRQQEVLKNNNEIALANLAQQNSALQVQQQIESSTLDIKAKQLEYITSLGLLTEAENVKAETALAKEVAALELRKQLTEAAFQNETQLNAIRLTTATQLLSASTPEEKSAVLEQGLEAEARVNSFYADRLIQIQAVNDAKLIGLSIDEKQKTLLAEISDLTSMLGSAFGDLGVKIAGAAAAFMQYGAASEELAQQEKKSLEDKIEGTSAYEYQQKLNAEKRTKFELDSTTKITNASKKMFKEKTAAYKLLDSVEKASQAYRLALSFAETAEKIKLWWQEVEIKVAAKATEEAATTGIQSAGFFSRIPMYISEIYAKTIGQLGIFGPPVAAALVAMALGAFAGGGRGGGGTNVPTAEERQETQLRGTVLGDETAQSRSVQNSLEIIKQTSVEDLSFSNRMVQLLESIDKGISGATKGLYNVVGLRGGTSAFGTVQGTSSSGINIPVLGGLFSSSTTKTITDTGIIITGFFTDLLDTTKVFVQQYEEITKVKKKSGFFGIGGGTRTSISYKYKDLPTDALEGLIAVFEDANSLILDIGDRLGIQEASIINTLSQLDVSTGLVSLKGLSGTALEDAIGALVNSILDKAAGSVFGQFEKYQQIGEGLLETVIRVLDANDKINLALSSIGKSTINASLLMAVAANDMQTISLDISEALVDAAGGLQNFLDQAKSFRENFLSEAEQMAPIRQAVNTEISRLLADVEVSTTTAVTRRTGFLGIGTVTEYITTVTTQTSELSELMNRLGIATLDTKEEFKLLVQSVDLTTDSGRQLYQELMNLAPTFAKLEDYEQELADARMDQELEILKLLRRNDRVKELSRQRELESLDESLRLGQMYIYALEDENDIRDKLIKARDQETAALEKTISTLKSSIQTLKDYKNSLLIGNISVLTPEQKYQQARQTALDLAAIAQGPATTPEEVAARDAALSKLPQATTAWLDASRVMYASSAQYTQDFNQVRNILDSTSTSLALQQTDAEKQLEELKTSTSFLESIDEKIGTVAELLPQYLAATAASSALASLLGITEGITAVPTIAATTTTTGTTTTSTAAPISLAAPTNITVAVNEQLAATITTLNREIAALKTEVAGLRTEQQTQANRAVTVTYDASNLNATQITTGITEAFRYRGWMARNTVDIV